MDLSFSGAGFMGCYYFGVVDCWNKYIPKNRVNRVAGASAGSLIAAYYLMDLPLSLCLKEIIELTEDIRRRPLGVFDRSNQIVDVLPTVLNKVFPDDAHKRVGNRLYVCMTRLKDMKKVIVNEFDSKQDLIDALNCSCFIPVWSGNHVSTYKGVKYIDGGFSDNLPTFDEHTIRICCFSGPSDISPYDRAKMELLSGTVLNTPLYFTLANCRRFRKALFPPPASFICDLLERGFHDTKDFILTNDLIQCDTCYGTTDFKDQPIYAKISPTITPSVSPNLSRVNSMRKTSNRTTLAPDMSSPERRPSFSRLLRAKLRNFSHDSRAPTSVGVPSVVIVGAEQELNQARPAELATGGGGGIVDGTESQADSGLDDSADSRDIINKIDLAPHKSAAAETSLSCSPASNSTELSSNGHQSPVVEASGAPANQNAGLFARRRSTLQQQEGPLLVIKDKFTLAPNPLPSCPPSPNLDRHCDECIRMRQEARMDLIEEEIKREAEKYRRSTPTKTGGLGSKLKSPLRWFRQIGVKNSYSMEEPPEAAPVIAQ